MSKDELTEYERSLSKFMTMLTSVVAVTAIGLLFIGQMDWFATVCESYIYFMAGAYTSIFVTANKQEMGTSSQFFRMVLGVAVALFAFGIQHIL